MNRHVKTLIAFILAIASCLAFTACETEPEEHFITDEDLALIQNYFLVPQMITYERFEEEILNPLKEKFGDELYESDSPNPEAFRARKLLACYNIFAKGGLEISADDRNVFGSIRDNIEENDRLYATVLRDYPIVDKYTICVLDITVRIDEIVTLDKFIKENCPNYTYQDLFYDYSLVEYDFENNAPRMQ